MSLSIILNGHPRTFSELEQPTLDQLIAELRLKSDRVAVEHNGQIVPRASWELTPIQEGDKLEVVHFVGGGGPNPLRRPEDVAESFQAVWNQHDMVALAALFCEDATFVNRFGHYVRGVQEIVALHAPIHETIYSDSTMENEVITTLALGDSAAVVHFWSRLTVGTAHPAGPHAVDTVVLAVLRLAPQGWLIQALENVTLTNPTDGRACISGVTSCCRQVLGSMSKREP